MSSEAAGRGVASPALQRAREWWRALPVWTRHVLALLLLLEAGILVYGHKVVAGPNRLLLGGSGDTYIFVWSMKWWSHAIGTWTNPLITNVVWAPTGFNLAGATTLPLPSILLAPLTVLVGPRFSYNLFVILALPLSGWGAYLLCWRLTRSFWPSVAGGYVFAFASYEMSQAIAGHPNLSFVFPVPFAGYLVVRRLDGSLGPRAFVAAMAGTLLLEFGVSTEVFATMTVFGAMTGVVALAFGPPAWRRRLLEVAGLTAIAYAVVGAVVAVYLYYAFAYPRPVKAFHPENISTDLANLMIPTELAQFGRDSFSRVSSKFADIPGKSMAYFGLPLLLILGHFFVTNLRRRTGRVLAAAMGVVLLLSFGPKLKVVGQPTISMPWALFQHLPLIGKALPGRFIVFVFLGAAVAVAIWLSAGRFPVVRWTMVGLTALTLFPNLSGQLWLLGARTPPFFAQTEYRSFLRPGEIIMVVDPRKGPPMLWQAESDFYYRQGAGYLGQIPSDAPYAPIRQRLALGHVGPSGGPELRAFLTSAHIRALVAFEVDPNEIDTLAKLLGVQPKPVGGVELFMLPSPLPAPST